MLREILVCLAAVSAPALAEPGLETMAGQVRPSVVSRCQACTSAW